MRGETLKKGTIIIAKTWRGRVDADYDGIVTCTVDNGGYRVVSRVAITVSDDGKAHVGAKSKLVTCGRKTGACGMKNPVLCTLHGQRARNERDWSSATSH